MPTGDEVPWEGETLDERRQRLRRLSEIMQRFYGRGFTAAESEYFLRHGTFVRMKPSGSPCVEKPGYEERNGQNVNPVG